MNISKANFLRVSYIFLFIIIIFLNAPSSGQAIEPKITDILITNNAQNVLLYARLADSFKTEMESEILAGLPTFFTLKLELYQIRSGLWDKKIISKEIKRTIKYDNLKKTFSIFTEGNATPAVFSDFESAQKAMAELNGIVVIPLKDLVKGDNYYLMMKVKIDKVRLPFHMEYIFFFVSFWDFETAWYRQSFSY